MARWTSLLTKACLLIYEGSAAAHRVAEAIEKLHTSKEFSTVTLARCRLNDGSHGQEDQLISTLAEDDAEDEEEMLQV